MKITIGQDGTSQIELGDRRCLSCENWVDRGFAVGQWGGRVTCTTCNGTGNGKRGGKGRCKGCSSISPGKMLNTDPKVQSVPCEGCNGTARQKENLTDWMPDDVFDQWLPHAKIEVVRQLQEQIWAEQHIGFGLGSCVDYGASWSMTDADLIERIRQHRPTLQTQVCKLLLNTIKSEDWDKPTHTITNSLLVVLKPTGFSVWAVPPK